MSDERGRESGEKSVRSAPYRRRVFPGRYLGANGELVPKLPGKLYPGNFGTSLFAGLARIRFRITDYVSRKFTHSDRLGL